MRQPARASRLMPAGRPFLTIVLAAVVLIVPAVAAAHPIADPGRTADERTAVGPSAAPPTPDVAPELTAATFANPPATVRPKYRWWMPLADTDDRELAAELQQMRDAGAGGAEVAAFGVAGSGNNTNPFLSTYGWGTPLWAQKVATMLSAAKADGLRLDFTIGPRWPATVPTVSDINDPRAAQQIVTSYEFHPGGTSRDGALPVNFDVAPPAGANKTLIAALVARCESATCNTQGTSPRLLDQASVTDVTGQVDAAGNLHYDFPGDASSEYAVVAFYQTATGQSLSGYTATGKNYVLDALSVAGAKATTDFYDHDILTPDVQHLIDQIGDADLFEDSLELGSTEKWTSDFVQQWQQRRGYSPIDVLPALAGAGDQGQSEKPLFDFGSGVGDRVRTDYRQTWSDLYINNRLDVLRDWTHSHGMQTRVQPYGGPIDIPEAASHIDVPEGESLAFGQAAGDYSNVEDYKVVAAGGHLGGEPVVSDECCAFSGNVWGSTASSDSDLANLEDIYRGFAGGVNQVVWHGFPYLSDGPAGAGSQEVWPGMSYGGNTSYSEAYGAKGNPNWADYRQVNDNLARMQLVLRQGKPRFDVGVYWQDFGLNGTGTTGTGSNRQLQSTSALAQQGYTYEYVSPAQLQSREATYQHGALFPDASAYHALLLDNQATMSVGAAQKLLQFARDGLPIVVVGDAPSSTPGYDAATAQDAQLRALMDDLMSQPDVLQVSTEAEVPDALQHAGVAAAAQHATDSSAILDVRRRTDSVDYYYLYNQTNTATTQMLNLAGDGVPYRLDTWTGAITPIANYRRGHGTVTVPAQLAGNDAEVIAVTPRRDATFHGAGQPAGGNAPGAPAPLRMDDWSLSVDSWTPGPSDLPGDTAHTTLGPVSVLADAGGILPAWTAITPANGYPVDLQDVSGVGTYTTHVTLDPRWSQVRGAYLSLGAAVDTVRISVNGTALAPVDEMDVRHVDVGRYLRPGDNTITVRVASTLLNAVRVAPGTGAANRARMDYGLFGPVTLTPYEGATAFLTAEALEDRLPLADGGFNRADLAVTNHSPQPVSVALSTFAPDGITATPTSAHVTLGDGESKTIAVDLRDAGLNSGSSTVNVTARASNGATATTAVALDHSDNMALNPGGTPLPRVIADANQDRYPAELAIDGSSSTFWVSWGRGAGQGPTAANPVLFGEDLGAPVTVGSVTVGGRSNWGVHTYDIQTSLDGTSWQTVASVADAPKTGATSTFPAVSARYVRLRITDSWDDATGANAQISEFEIRA